MRKPTITRDLAWAAAWDADAKARREGMHKYDPRIADIFWGTFDKLWPRHMDGWPAASCRCAECGAFDPCVSNPPWGAR